MQTKFLLSLFLISSLIVFGSFSTVNDSVAHPNMQGEQHYYFKFNHNNGYYTSIILCSGRSHLQILNEHGYRINNEHHYTTYGPYYSHRDADHKQGEVKQHYNYQTHHIDGLSCNDYH